MVWPPQFARDGKTSPPVQYDSLFVRVIIALIAVIVLVVGTGLRKIEAPHANENGSTKRHGHRVNERVGLTADFAGSAWHGGTPTNSILSVLRSIYKEN